jgi:DNA topoisomerase-2
MTFLEGLMDPPPKKKTATGAAAAAAADPPIKDATSLSTHERVDIKVMLTAGTLEALENQRDAHGVNGVEKLLKLTTTVSATNMYLFDAAGKLHKYQSIFEIIEAFYPVRLALYQARKTYCLKALADAGVRLGNRARYIQETLSGTVDLRRKTGVQVVELMTGRGYALVENSFHYLTKMPMDSVTEENVHKILQEKETNEREYRELEGTTPQQLWARDLAALERTYGECRARETTATMATVGGAGSKANTVVKIRKPRTTNAVKG